MDNNENDVIVIDDDDDDVKPAALPTGQEEKESDKGKFITQYSFLNA